MELLLKFLLISNSDFLLKEVRNGKLNGLKFKRQHSIGNYIVDFYCAAKRLVVELDGEVHNNADQKEKDESRDINLTEMNFKVLRIPNSKVLNKIEEEFSVNETNSEDYKLIEQKAKIFR